MPKTRLSTLKFEGDEIHADALRKLVSLGEALPALRHLTLEIMSINWSVMRHMSFPALETLKLDGCELTIANVADVGVALAHLPALETLILHSRRIEVEN